MTSLANFRTLPNLLLNHLRSLPMVILYLTDGCNSKCAMCDIWKSPRRNMDMNLVERIVASCEKLGTQMVVLSGGEAMQHPEWPTIARQFRQAKIKVWLLTNALWLRKQVDNVVENLDAVTVSLDAATPELYHKIRGVDALNIILEGMQVVSQGGVPVSTRTTIMHCNFHQMPQIVDTALENGASQVSFLAVDTVNPYAFGPRFLHDSTIPLVINDFGGLIEADLPEFETILETMEKTHATHFATGRIAEKPEKLRNLYNYFAAPYGKATFIAPRCNAPHISTVINVDGTLQPCYFLPKTEKLHGIELEDALNDFEMIELRTAYRNGERSECTRCVCPLYRGPRALLRGF